MSPVLTPPAEKEKGKLEEAAKANKANFATTEKLVVKLKAGNRATVPLLVESDQAVPSIKLALNNVKGLKDTPCQPTVTSIWSDTSLSEKAKKKEIPYEFIGCSPPSNLTRELRIVGSEGIGNQREVYIHQWESYLNRRASLSGLLVATVVVLIATVVLRYKKYSFSDPLGPATWESTSWASNITIAAGVFASIANALSFPERPVHDTKASYAILTGFGLTLVAAAPFIYRIFSRVAEEKRDGTTALKIEGKTGGFLIASIATLWGVFVQMVTQYHLADEISVVYPNDELLTWFMKALLIAVGVGLIFYATRTIVETVRINVIQNKEILQALKNNQSLPEIALKRKVALL
jgi:hypothetical protein